MCQSLIALFCGTLFGAGLAVSGMIDPTRVRGFLDLFGRWDPTLAFVMAGALLPMAIAWILKRRIRRPFAAADFSLPDTTRVDFKLIAGAALFGGGWGVTGLCPGPAVAGLAIAPVAAATFVAAMLAGMGLHRIVSKGL